MTMRPGGQRGMVTVELAIGLIAVVMLLGTLTGVVLLGVTQAGLHTASAEVARHLARGDAKAADAAAERAPAGVTATTRTTREGVAVTLTAGVKLPGLGVVSLSSHAFAPWEPGEGP
ncbi:MAG: TadE family type IV pilus minor pilin [Propionibacteriaceae bacterium]|nr:TadE family type IV pilus minor pilin [Propionibacteriaceae bacterium]